MSWSSRRHMSARDRSCASAVVRRRTKKGRR